MSRRGQITMTEAELLDYYAEQKVINVATIGPRGRPHLAPLWYFLRDGELATWTYGRSQKAVNLRRLPEATVLIESGEVYEELRGVSLEAEVELVTDTPAVTEMGVALMQRYAGAQPGHPVPEEMRAFVAGQAPKRIGLIFHPTKTVSWDHRKLGGKY